MRWAKPKIGNVKDGINCVLLWVPRAGDILESILPRHERAEKGLVPVTYFNIDLGEVVIGTIRKREESGRYCGSSSCVRAHCWRLAPCTLLRQEVMDLPGNVHLRWLERKQKGMQEPAEGAISRIRSHQHTRLTTTEAKENNKIVPKRQAARRRRKRYGI